MYGTNLNLRAASAEMEGNHEFENASGNAWWRRLRARFTGRRRHLLSFDDVLDVVQVTNERHLGLRVINVRDIIGTVGRHGDFDRDFLPLRRELKPRWISIHEARYRGNPLPPVELVKLGDGYFVRDGHHRISVARHYGQDFIEAVVTELDFVPCPECASIRDTTLIRALAG
jgi:hypothetical protein